MRRVFGFAQRVVGVSDYRVETLGRSLGRVWRTDAGEWAALPVSPLLRSIPTFPTRREAAHYLYDYEAAER